MGLLYHYLSGLARTLSVFVGVALGTALFALLGLIDTAAVGQAPWLAPPSPIPAVRPELNLAAALSFVLAYLAVLVNRGRQHVQPRNHRPGPRHGTAP